MQSRAAGVRRGTWSAEKRARPTTLRQQRRPAVLCPDSEVLVFLSHDLVREQEPGPGHHVLLQVKLEFLDGQVEEASASFTAVSQFFPKKFWKMFFPPQGLAVFGSTPIALAAGALAAPPADVLANSEKEPAKLELYQPQKEEEHFMELIFPGFESDSFIW